MAMEIIGNRYYVAKLIGEGGMADVYLAVDAILRRQVAIKVLRGELNNDPVNLARFEREASAITKLSHPNIVEVYDVGEDNGRNYIVMEYVPGKTLKQLIKARGDLQPDEAINIMKQLVSATSHAHRNGVIHRDIKSQNVIIKDDGTVKLSDFGIAFTNDQQQLTQTDTVMGSVHYLAPELAKGQQATVQSDIYSLGIVFYEMLTGDVPYHGDTAVEIAIKHMHESVPSVRAFNSTLPQSVENIVIRSTARDRENRYESADAMYDDLVTCLDLSRMHEQKLIIPAKNEKATVQSERKPAAGSYVRKKKAVKVKKSSSFNPLTVLAILAALALSLGMIYIIQLMSGNRPISDDKIKMPDVANYTLEDATAYLATFEINVGSVEYEATDDIPKGVVLYSSPMAGNEVGKNTDVVLHVSSGTRFTVGNYVGKNINSIQGILENNGFEVVVTKEASADKAEGTILSQSLKAGTVLDPLEVRKIEFKIAAPLVIYIPTNLVGRDVNEVAEEFKAMGAKVKLTQLPAEGNIGEDGNYIVQPGTVVSVKPEGGTNYTQTGKNVIELTYY